MYLEKALIIHHMTYNAEILIEAIFHSINLVSPNSLLNEVSPRDFRVQTNELIHHEATGVHDGNS